MVTKNKCVICGTDIMPSSTYCRKHAALYRWGHTDKEQKMEYSKEKKKINVIKSFASKLPSDVSEIFVETAGKSEAKNLEIDLDRILNFARMAENPPTTSRSVGGYESVLYGSMYVDKNNMPNPYSNYASDFNLSHIEDMLKCGQIVFGLAIKKAPVASIFRNRRSYSVELDGGGSESFQKTISKNMYEMLPKSVMNFLSALEYGASFNEVVWDIDRGNPIVSDINSIYVGSISKVLYKNGAFNGFEQNVGYTPQPIKIGVDQSLVITYNKKFRNIYGESILKAVYPFFFFYDLIWRSFVRYLERTGTPQLIATAPSNLTVRRADGTYAEALDEALGIAYRAGRSPAVAIPSDTDPEGNKLWTLDYLRADERGGQFVEALNLLGLLILRSIIIPDTIATMQGTGSYGMSSVHYQMALLDDERILVEIISQLNKYLLQKYIQYKYGANSNVKINLVTEGLNPAEKENLLKLVLQAVNSKHAITNRIDWKTLAAVNNIPFLSEEDAYVDPNFSSEPNKDEPVEESEPVDNEEEISETKKIENMLKTKMSLSNGLIISDKELDEIKTH